MNPIPEHIKNDASKALDAARKKDWSLHAHIMRRYPFGSDERKALDEAMREESANNRQAPEYFK